MYNIFKNKLKFYKFKKGVLKLESSTFKNLLNFLSFVIFACKKTYVLKKMKKNFLFVGHA